MMGITFWFHAYSIIKIFFSIIFVVSCSGLENFVLFCFENLFSQQCHASSTLLLGPLSFRGVVDGVKHQECLRKKVFSSRISEVGKKHSFNISIRIQTLHPQSKVLFSHVSHNILEKIFLNIIGVQCNHAEFVFFDDFELLGCR